MQDNVKRFFDQLKSYDLGPCVFNPWVDLDVDYDESDKSPLMRTQYIYDYLNARLGKAKYICVAEALGNLPKDWD